MRRTLILYVIPAVLLILVALPFVLFWSALPDPMAIHWGFGGRPNGSAPPLVLLAVLAGFF